MKKIDILIIWGWPSACSLWIMLRKYWYKVIILEKASFPKHNVWESMLPIVTSDYMKLIWLDKEIKAQNFPKKYGTTFIWGKDRRPWNIFFDSRLNTHIMNYKKKEINSILNGNYVHSYQVNRYIFDELFTKKAKNDWVIFLENKQVIDVILNNKWDIRWLRCKWWEEFYAKFFVDGSWQSSFLWNKFWLRNFNNELWFSAIYWYFKNFNFLNEFLSKHTQYIISVDIWWIWFIYIGKWIVSVWLVTNKWSISDNDFFNIIKNTKEINKLITKKSILVDYLWEKTDKLYRARNRSYFNKKVYWNNFLLIWDAAWFVDPILSWWLSLGLMSWIIAAPYIHKYFQWFDWTKIFKKYQDLIFKDMDNYYQLAKYWYGNNKSVNSWFWKAKSILWLDISNKFNKRAFTFLASWSYYITDNLIELNEIRISDYWYNHEDITEIKHLFDENIITKEELLFLLKQINMDLSSKDLKKMIKYLTKKVFIFLWKLNSVDVCVFTFLTYLYKKTKKILFLNFIAYNYYIINNVIAYNKDINILKSNILAYSIFLEKKYNYKIINSINFIVNDGTYNIKLFNWVKVYYIVYNGDIINTNVKFNNYLN